MDEGLRECKEDDDIGRVRRRKGALEEVMQNKSTACFNAILDEQQTADQRGGIGGIIKTYSFIKQIRSNSVHYSSRF